MEVEGKKPPSECKSSKIKAAQAERLLAAFDIAVEEASGMADKAQSVKAGRNNSYSKKKHKKEIDDATNTDARERLVEDCHLADEKFEIWKKNTIKL